MNASLNEVVDLLKVLLLRIVKVLQIIQHLNVFEITDYIVRK